MRYAFKYYKLKQFLKLSEADKAEYVASLLSRAAFLFQTVQLSCS
jgi:hypothetical protein